MMLRNRKTVDLKTPEKKEIKQRKTPTPRGKKRTREEYIKVPKNVQVDTVLDRISNANCICINDSRENIEKFISKFCENNADSVYCLNGFGKPLKMPSGIVQDKAGNGVGIIQSNGQINYLPNIIPAPFIKTAEKQGEIIVVKSAKKNDTEKLGKYIVDKAAGISEMEIDEDYSNYYDALSDSEGDEGSPKKVKKQRKMSPKKGIPSPPPILPAPKKQVEQLEKKIMQAVEQKREENLLSQISNIKLRPGKPFTLGKRGQDYNELIKGKKLLKPPVIKQCNQGYIWSHAEKKCIAIRKNMQELLSEQMEKRRKAMREEPESEDEEWE
jgi:hypothetical protein